MVGNCKSPVAVFFDNLQVVHTRGPLVEETHYYPFGLTMAGISSKALKANYGENKYKYNGIEQNTDFDINMYDAFYRNLDRQLGRFWQCDLKPTDDVSLYAGLNNDPILFMDPFGDTTWVYGKNGQYLGTVNDKLANQVHFVDNPEDRKPFDAESLNAKDSKALGKAFRKASFAFIGKNSVKDLKKIMADPKNITKVFGQKEVLESAVKGEISGSKEIRFSQIENIPDRETRSLGDLPAKIDGVLSLGEQLKYFIAGHTHTSLASYGKNGEKTLETLTVPSSRNENNLYDFNPLLFKNKNERIKSKQALIVVSFVGFSIYTSGNSPYPTPNKGIYNFHQIGK